MTARQVDQQWADSLREIPKYDYQRSSDSRSLIELFYEWFYDFLREVFDGRADSVVDFIGYAIFAFLLFLVYRLFIKGNKGVPLGRRRRGVIEFDDEELAEAADYDRLVGAAIEQQEFRIAVRLMYQRTLADLRDIEAIDWRSEKTDSDYVREVSKRDQLLAPFKTAVRSFQLIWYGEQSISEDEFLDIKGQFDELRAAIQGNPH